MKAWRQHWDEPAGWPPTGAAPAQLRGWCWRAGLKQAPAIRLHLGGEMLALQVGEARPDVASSLGDPAAATCGFSALLPTGAAGWLVLEARGGGEEAWDIIWARWLEPAPALPAPAHVPLSPPEGWWFHWDKPAWDRVTGDRIRVEGWCLRAGRSQAPHVRCLAAGQSFDLSPTARPDVAAAFPSEPAAGACGFSGEIAAPAGLQGLTLLAEDPGRGWVPFAHRRISFADSQQPAAARYAEWLQAYGSSAAQDHAGAAARAGALAGRPHFRIGIRSGRPAEAAAWSRSVGSLLEQAWGGWTAKLLLAADDRPLLDALAPALADGRVSLLHPEHLLSDPSASRGLSEAADYLLLLDAGDRLAPDALLRLAESVRTCAAPPPFVSHDADLLTAEGSRQEPRCLPSWDPDWFAAEDYLRGQLACRLEGIAPEVLAQAALSPAGTSALVPTVLLLAHTEPCHVSALIRHRVRTESIPCERGADFPRWLAQAHPGATLGPDPAQAGSKRLHWPPPARGTRVSVILPTRDCGDLLERCLAGLLDGTDWTDLEILVVDNGSREPRAHGVLQAAAKRGVHVLRYDGPFNYSAINNRAASLATGQLLCFLNNDTEILHRDWLAEMAAQAVRPGVGAVGALLLYPDDTVQHAGVILGIGGVASHLFKGQPADSPGYLGRLQVAHRYSAVTAACMVLRRSAFLEVGGFDAAHLPVAFNDIDLCLRLERSGLSTVWTPHARLRHHESASRGAENTAAKQARFRQEVSTMMGRWEAVLRADPRYSPLLTLETEDASMSFPPRVPVAGAPAPS